MVFMNIEETILLELLKQANKDLAIGIFGFSPSYAIIGLYG
jgi:hypothetical protein